jgi:hypothetical protein
LQGWVVSASTPRVPKLALLEFETAQPEFKNHLKRAFYVEID